MFLEGGRYDGRGATDCADLLLQGLIAWRRDTTFAEVLAEPETPTVAEAQQQQPTTLPEGVTAESVCTGNPGRQACWLELDTLPDCYVWNPRPHVLEIDTWSGACSGGFGTGTGVFYRVDQEGLTLELPYVNGVLHGTEVLRWVDGSVEKTPWVNGVRHGTSIGRNAEGTVRETPYVNGVKHGTAFTRYADGRVGQAPYVNGVQHGTQIMEYGPDSVVAVEEYPYVNGEIHGTNVTRYKDGAMNEIPYVNGVPHGTETWRGADGRVNETVWVNGAIESRRCVAGCD